jgi:hypothetical protein
MSNIISFISFHSLNILTQNINAYLLLIFWCRFKYLFEYEPADWRALASIFFF